MKYLKTTFTFIVFCIANNSYAMEEQPKVALEQSVKISSFVCPECHRWVFTQTCICSQYPDKPLKEIFKEKIDALKKENKEQKEETSRQ
jgi:hypothetical protein